ncbi:phosphatidylinositol 4,5-bisphosphate 3-kinase catalytic subunit gamma isoform [Synchiropus picturatus]
MDFEPFQDGTIGQHFSSRRSSTQGFPENPLKFICQFRPGPGPPAAPLDEGNCSDIDCERVTIVLPAQCTVYQLRLQICMQVEQQNNLQDPLAFLDPQKYSLLYARGEDWYEVYDDCQIVRTLDIPWTCDSTACLTAHIVIAPVLTVASEEKQKQQQIITYLIGHDLEKDTSDRLGELTFTRRKLALPRKLELKNRNDYLYATEPWVTNVPLPEDLQKHLDRKLTVTLHYMSEISFSTEVTLNATPAALLDIFKHVMNDQKRAYDTTESFVLQVSGREEVLSGDHPLKEFLWIHHCLKTNKEVHLFVLPMSHLVNEAVTFEDLPLVDGFSGQFSSHEDLCLDGKDVEDIFMISLWDCNRKLRVKLLGIDIPKLPNKCQQTVYVNASILHGNKVLSTVSSAPKSLADEVLWNEWLEFDVSLRDLPRGAKLGFTVNERIIDSSTLTRDSKASVAKDLKGKVLYFINLLLIDHRSLLSQGFHTLHMWSYPQEGEAATYQADKLSSAGNPDVADSMAITFFLDQYSFPVVLPNQSNVSVSSDTLTLSSSLQAAPSSPTGSPESSPKNSVDASTLKHNMMRFRENSVQYVSNLPHFLRSVDWVNHRVVEDVHWLLRNWDPAELELTVALELLSVDFADEVVRKLAVQRLESLSNNDVLKYLLQLVQTLKVEPYHDSFLARFLIQRALRSKRVGHFFFWYVRSEVAGCPFFRQRMAVILEAYLLGCGQAMLDSFRQQVQAVEALREVTLAIKQLYPDKTDLPPSAPLRLQELLRNCNLPKEFLLPFDPRIKAGTILLEKCKVMASKKKPLWLEFSAMPSPTPTTPVGIIFKEGDDLRQDMLVIQMLVLMDSIWQENSLDLNLIPYGCISTGYNIGMIEIVRDAVTIAAIQRNRGGTSGAFQTEALFEWLKSKCPLQEIHFQTVERFVKSCAGYCVATYVLGIGDRHNDNIMVTDGGNLFHIDFGHILGNRKQFLGVNRERTLFVLTPDFVYVMGRVKGRKSLYFQRFVDTCIRAYLSLRTHSHLLINLFSLMLLTGIPELSGAEDMRYLREALQEEQAEAGAKEHFLRQINKCEELGWTVQTNWWFHLLVGIK